MAQTTYTLSDIIARVEDYLDIEQNSDLEKKTALYATNDFIRYLQTSEMEMNPEKYRLYYNWEIDSTGLDLSKLTDLYSPTTIRVRQNGVLVSHRLGNGSGWYIKDGQLYFTDGFSGEVEISYLKKPDKIEIDFTSPLPIDDDLIIGLENMIASRYLKKDQSDPNRAENLHNDALAEINRHLTQQLTAYYF